MTVVRKKILDFNEETVYHCISRCVRGAFLHGIKDQFLRVFSCPLFPKFNKGKDLIVLFRFPDLSVGVTDDIVIGIPGEHAHYCSRWVKSAGFPDRWISQKLLVLPGWGGGLWPPPHNPTLAKIRAFLNMETQF